MTTTARHPAFIAHTSEFDEITGEEPWLSLLAEVDAHEGPVYFADEDALYFTSAPRPGLDGSPAVEIKRLSLGEPGVPSVLVSDANAANGMAADLDGNLIVCEQGSLRQPARITRIDRRTGERTTLVDKWRGLPLNSPNDVVVAGDGAIWFTDPSYGHLQGFRPPPIPDHVGEFDPTGATVVFEVTIDDHAEVWVNGTLPHALGDVGGPVIAGFNAPNRVLLTDDARPGERFQIAVFGINGPISAAPRNYIWMRSATLDLYGPERANPAQAAELEIDRTDARLGAIVAPDAALERVAGGFVFTEGPVWSPDGALLFSSPNTNAIYRWHPSGRVSVFRSKSGYSGVDVGRFTQPGSNGLTFDPDGRLTICQHGNRRVIRVEPHGNVTVLADRYDGRRLSSPNDLVYRSDGTLFFTDPPFGLPGAFEDPKKELPFSGVFAVRDGSVTLLTDELEGPNGLAFSPDERYLYVGNWDPERKVIMRYELGSDLQVTDARVLFDTTDADGEDAIDGIKVDRAGNLYACGPGGVWVLSPEGEHLGTLRLPEAPHNLAWGDGDGRTLYVTALTSVYRLRLHIPGIRPE